MLKGLILLALLAGRVAVPVGQATTVDPTAIALPDLAQSLSKLIESAPYLAIMAYFYRALDERHKLLYDRYTTLNARYIRDIRAVAKMPADEFADDLNNPGQGGIP